ncbi:N-terminal protein methyltransferase [Aspergillus lucknowensis]|uniref:Alpha N-terminal protein methyltransferase 1 n=1 Tax=Aspergillus lucknowensis TaxID=176173 RepID=A0ABR4LM74_9EURO
MSDSKVPTDSAGTPEDAPPDSRINHAAAIEYWNDVPATSAAMLAIMGDYPWYTRIDLRGSKAFISKVRRLIPGCSTDGKLETGVDCGAGVGRVTEGCLSHVCEVVDAVEPVEKLARVIEETKLKAGGGVGDIYVLGIESWAPEKKYDLIWAQFCVGHVTDVQLVEYFIRCREALTETGFLAIKENISTEPHGRDMYDDEDSSVTRTDKKFRALFEEAKLTVIASELQLGYPKKFNLLPVRFYALRPKS